ncbi:MAG: hypothetical protein LBJ32_01715 [Oscillospiraceae bacterium]|jgi:serine/threonine protein kinase|nr:hypothetical protein [Oscillospiraceae bacterium]
MNKSNAKKTSREIFNLTKVIAMGLSILIVVSTVNIFIPVAKVAKITGGSKNNKSFGQRKKSNFPPAQTSRNLLQFIKENPIKSMVLTMTSAMLAVFGSKYLLKFIESKKTPKSIPKMPVLEFSSTTHQDIKPETRNVEIPTAPEMPALEFSSATHQVVNIDPEMYNLKISSEMCQTELKSALELIIIFLQEYVIDDKFNDEFANIPFKPIFSESNEAKKLISEIRKNIESISLNHKVVSKIKMKALKIKNRITERKYFQKLNRTIFGFSQSFKVEGKSLSFPEFCAKLEKKGISLNYLMSNSISPVFKANDLKHKKVLVLKIFRNEDRAKIEKDLHIKFEKFTSKVSKDLIELNISGPNGKNKTKIYIVVSEFLPGFDLKKFRCLCVEDDGLNEYALNLMYQITFMLKKLHKSGIIFGDLKEGNFCICKEKEDDKNFVVKMIDFGGRYTTINKEFNSPHDCTLMYSSPENLKSWFNSAMIDPSSKKTIPWFEKEKSKNVNEEFEKNFPLPQGDIWTLGCMIFNILKGTPVFPPKISNLGEKVKNLYEQHLTFKEKETEGKNQYSEQPPKNLMQLINRCLIFDLKKRATLEQIEEWLPDIAQELGCTLYNDKNRMDEDLEPVSTTV